MDVVVYIKNSSGGYVALDLYKDEKIEVNLSVKNLSDISKVRSDFSQDFSLPPSPINNQLFQYWYESDVDGTFNANIRVDAYIEINSFPYRYGSLQLNDCKLKNNEISNYNVTFFGASVNLSDKFSDDSLKALPLSDYNHNYDSSVIAAIQDDHLSNGDIYYPLINAVTYMDAGNNAPTDLFKNGNSIIYKQFKPAIRLLKIIEAIEQKYDVTFSRDFFDRAVFYNLFLWLHREAGQMKTISDTLLVDFDTFGVDYTAWSAPAQEVNLMTNVLSLIWLNIPQLQPNFARAKVLFWVYTDDTVSYKVEVYDGANLFITFDNLQGDVVLDVYSKKYEDDPANRNFTFYVSSLEGTFTFTTKVGLEIRNKAANPFLSTRIIHSESSAQTTSNAVCKIHEQIPEMKVKDFFNSLVNMFNLVIVPASLNSYYIDTLDSWYGKGKMYNINPYIDIKNITVKKPNIKKKIEFLFQKTETVLAKQYFDNNQIGYGDLKATYNIAGEDMKIESYFENMLFERLVDEGTGLLTELQVGYSVNLENKPVKGKPIIFYRNGRETPSSHIHISGTNYTYNWHTSTEDNKALAQVTSCINFGADNSSYFYQPIFASGYFNYWKTYIEELYNRKTRVLSFKMHIPTWMLKVLNLNDRFAIGDKRYKISNIKPDLVSGYADCEVFTDLGTPLDSINNIIPLTVDTTDITVDSDLITVDTVSTYSPVTSYVTNEISLTEYNATKSEENFELKISANTNWSISIVGSWVTSNKITGNKTDYIRLKINKNTSTARTTTATVTIGSDVFTLIINQE